jgi:hypothetical protein
VPLALAILILLLEVGLVTKNVRFVRRIVLSALLLLLLAIPWSEGWVFSKFLQTVVQAAGSPLWLTTWLLMGFYGWAWFRGAPQAGRSLLAVGALQSIVGPRTIDWDTFIDPQPWQFLIIGAALLVHGIRARSSQICTTACVIATFGLWWLLPQIQLREFRTAICFHVLWFAALALNLMFQDSFTRALRMIGAAMFPLAILAVTFGGAAAEIPMFSRGLYVLSLMAACLLIARVWRSIWFLYGFGGMLGLMMYAALVGSFRRVADSIGRDATTAFLWSLGTLLLAFLISAQKAHWLPRKMWPWRNGNGRTTAPPTEPPKPANGLSMDVSS